MNPLIPFLIAINLFSFIQILVDKRLAISSRRRISELQLITPALFGGMIGIIAGIILFRHKSAKRSFQCKLLISILAFFALLYFFGNTAIQYFDK